MSGILLSKGLSALPISTYLKNARRTCTVGASIPTRVFKVHYKAARRSQAFSFEEDIYQIDKTITGSCKPTLNVSYVPSV